MKQKSIFLLSFLVITTIGCNTDEEQKKTKKQEAVTSTVKSKSCIKDQRIPRSVDSLNTKAMLTFDLKDDCNFQPLHMQVREVAHSSELVGRFSATSNKWTGGYDLNKIEFKYFEIAKSPDTVVVNKASVSRKRDGNKGEYIAVTLSLVKNEQLTEIQKNKWVKGDIDTFWSGKVPVKKGELIDINIENEEEIYKEAFEDIDINIPRGRQCRGTIK